MTNIVALHDITFLVGGLVAIATAMAKAAVVPKRKGDGRTWLRIFTICACCYLTVAFFLSLIDVIQPENGLIYSMPGIVAILSIELAHTRKQLW